MRQPYEDGVISLSRACDSLGELNTMLAGCSRDLARHTIDLPRTACVTENRKCYELVAESEVRSAQYQLTSELEPRIRELLEGAEDSVARLQEREASLQQSQSATDQAEEDDQQAAVLHAECLEQKKALEKEIARLEQDIARKEAMLAGLS